MNRTNERFADDEVLNYSNIVNIYYKSVLLNCWRATLNCNDTLNITLFLNVYVQNIIICFNHIIDLGKR